MNAEAAVAVLAICWLVGGLLLMSRSIQRGRALAEALALRHPETYEALGRPRPGYFQSVRRSRFAQFVGRHEYEALPDPVLAAEFEAYRKAEARLVVSLIASLLLVGLLVLGVRHLV